MRITVQALNNIFVNERADCGVAMDRKCKNANVNKSASDDCNKATTEIVTAASSCSTAAAEPESFCLYTEYNVFQYSGFDYRTPLY